MHEGEIGLYEDPAVYDILHAPGTAEEVRGLERIWERWGGSVPAVRRGRTPATWLEPACGTGRYLRVAAARGVRVLGIDHNAAMIAFARDRLRTAGVLARSDLRAGDMTRMPRDWRGRADLAFCLINSIRHLESDRALLTHLRSVGSCLRPGGLYAVGITLTTYGAEFPSEDVWKGARGGCRVTQVIQFLPPARPAETRARAEHVHSHLIVRRGTRTEHRDSRYILRTYSRPQWESVIDRAGLGVKATVDEDGEPLRLSPSGYAIWLLERPTPTARRPRPRPKSGRTRPAPSG